MAQNVMERMKANNTDYKIAVFRQKQSLPYEAKVNHARQRAWEFYEEINKQGKNVHISVGGLDSITLLLFLRSIGIDLPAVSVSSLEDKSIQAIHKQLGVQSLKPLKSKVEVLREFGYPVLSKETAGKIALLQNPSKDNATVRHAIMTGETGEYGGNRKGTRMKMSQKWLNKFGGPENERYGTDYQICPFKVSDRCCYYLKERPCDIYARDHKSYPYLGLMASEHGRREKSLMINGCNLYGKTTRSAPFAIFDRQDILQLALDLNVPVPEIYGGIARREDGTLYTPKAQRTGCSMCGFGIHLEKRPHRFDRLRDTNPGEWGFWMYRQGWGEVLTYIGVGWERMPSQVIQDIALQVQEEAPTTTKKAADRILQLLNRNMIDHSFFLDRLDGLQNATPEVKCEVIQKIEKKRKTAGRAATPYEIIHDGAKKNRRAGQQGNMTRQTFARWAGEKIGEE